MTIAERLKSKERMQKKRELIKQLSEQGLTQQAIADKVGCSRETVAKYGVKKDLKAKILSLYGQGLTQKQIAQQCNCAESSFYKCNQ